MGCMMESQITCSFCGHAFDPADAQAACQTCPLQNGCRLVRCPACGFEMVDPRSSRLARLAARLFARKHSVDQALDKPAIDEREKI